MAVEMTAFLAFARHLLCSQFHSLTKILRGLQKLIQVMFFFDM